MDDKTKQLPGCTDGGCMYGHPGGMHTNGGCQCERELRRAKGGLKAVREIRALRARAEKAERELEAERSWNASRRGVFDRIGKALEDVREKRASGEPLRDDGREVEALVRALKKARGESMTTHDNEDTFT